MEEGNEGWVSCFPWENQQWWQTRLLGDLLQVSAKMLYWARVFFSFLEKPVPAFLFGDQTQDENEKAGKQKVRFHAVVFVFPRF